MSLKRLEFRNKRKGNVKLHDISQVLYLPFNNGLAIDRSGYNNHGTVYGATKTKGKIGDALSFDGVDDYVLVADSASLRPSEITVSCQAKISNKADRNFIGLISKRTNNFGVYLEYSETWRHFRWYLGDETTYHLIESTYPLYTFGEWFSVAASYDGERMRIFFNGQLNREGAIDVFTISHSGDLLIGRDIDPGKEVYGIIGEVRIYNRALSQAEIKRIMYLRGF